MTNYKSYVMNKHDAKKYLSRMAENAKKNGLIIEYCITRHIDGYTSMIAPQMTIDAVKNIAYDMVHVLDPETLEKLEGELEHD